MPRRACWSPTPRRPAMSTRCRSSIMFAPNSCSISVENWEFLAPQTEEEAGESQDTVSIDDPQFAQHPFRQSITPIASRARSSRRRRRCGCTTLHRHPLPQRPCERRERASPPATPTAARPTCAPASSRIENAIRRHDARAGGARTRVRRARRAGRSAGPRRRRSPAPVEQAGGRLLVGLRRRRSMRGQALFRRSPLPAHLRLVARRAGWRWCATTPLDPVNLAVDNSGNLLVLSSDGADGTVYSFNPGTTDGRSRVIPPTPAGRHPGAATSLPVNYWVNGEFKDQLDPKTYRFTTLAEMFARDVGRAEARAICLARRQPGAARVPHLPAGAGQPSRLALLGCARQLWLRHRQGRRTRVFVMQCFGGQDL